MDRTDNHDEVSPEESRLDDIEEVGGLETSSVDGDGARPVDAAAALTVLTEDSTAVADAEPTGGIDEPT